MNLADQFHFVCGNGSESKLTSLSYSLACLIESFLSQALKFPFMRLRPYSLIASKKLSLSDVGALQRIWL